MSPPACNPTPQAPTKSFRQKLNLKPFAFQVRFPGSCFAAEIGDNPVDQLLAEIKVRDLPSLKLHRHCHGVFILQELFNLLQPIAVVMIADPDTEFHFLLFACYAASYRALRISSTIRSPSFSSASTTAAAVLFSRK